MRAFLVDYFLMLAAFLLLALVGAQLQSSPRARAALMVLAIAFALFYEPVMVSQTGGTVGHHLKNICVVSDKTQQSPGMFAALVRSLTKMLLGGLSILWMVTSRRQQAIHDAIAGVTVRIKNPRLARRRDYVR